MAEQAQMEAVGSTIPADLRERLTVIRKEADRSEAAEIRQAIRAWVETREPEPAK